MDKKKVLIFVDWFYPGFRAGGPIQSVINFIGHLKDKLDFFVFTRDHDYCKDTPYRGVKSDVWTSNYDGASVYYVSRKNLTISTIKKILSTKNYGVIFLNSFFSFYFTILPLILLKSNRFKGKIIVAPRGMLLKQALCHKGLKKILYIYFAKLFFLYKNVIWISTSQEEEKVIKNIFGMNSRTLFFPNLPPKVREKLFPSRKEKNRARFVFNSRVHKHKNLLKVLKWLGDLGNQREVQLDIYGLIDDKRYWQDCQEAIKSLPSNINVSYRGVIEHQELMESLHSYHFMILPTEGENYGYSIIEALSVGCPVIISDRTRWQNLEKNNAGWDIPLENDQRFIQVVKQALDMSQEEFNIISQGAYDYALSVSKDILGNQKGLKDIIR